MKVCKITRFTFALFALPWLTPVLFFTAVSASHPAPASTSFSSADYLNPNTGRFWSMDSFEGNQSDPASLHKYLYCHGNPVNAIDPSGYAGELTEQQATLIVTGLLGAAVITSIHQALTTATWNINRANYHHEVATTVAMAEEADLVRPKTRQEFKDRIKEKTKNEKGSFIFLHGTSSGSWAGFESGKVDFTQGRGDFGMGFYTTPFPLGIFAAAKYALQKQQMDGGLGVVLIFSIKNEEYLTLRGLPMTPNSAAHSMVYPGYDYVFGPLGFGEQYKWQPGRGGSMLLKGFKGFVPIPEINATDWDRPE